MKVCKHAVRRYKQRLGGKSASRKRIVRKIQSEISSGRRKIKNNHIYIETPKFTAVCYKGTVITILLPEEQYNPKEMEETDELLMQQRDAQ